MKNSLYDRIWRRESGYGSHYSSIRSIYGSKEWVDDLDIVNELGGHTGCVNALSYVCLSVAFAGRLTGGRAIACGRRVPLLKVLGGFSGH